MGPSHAREVFQKLKSTTIRDVVRELGDTNWAKATKDEMVETVVKSMVGEDGMAEEKKSKRRTLAGSSREKARTAPIPGPATRKRKHAAEEVEEDEDADESASTTRRATRRHKKDEEQEDESVSAVRTTRSGIQAVKSQRVTTTTKRKRDDNKELEEAGESISDNETKKPPRRRLRGNATGSESISSPARLTREEATHRTARTKIQAEEESPSRSTRTKAQTQASVSRSTRTRTEVDMTPSTHASRGATRNVDNESPSRATRSRGAASSRVESPARGRRAATSASDAEEEAQAEGEEEEEEEQRKTESTSPSKRSRGRPPKAVEEEEQPEAAELTEVDESVPAAKQGRGRPQKSAQLAEDVPTDEPRRGRGRTEITSARAHRSIKRPNPYPAYASPISAAKEKARERAGGKRSRQYKPGPASKAQKVPQRKKPRSAKLDCVEVPSVPHSWKDDVDGEYDSDPEFGGVSNNGGADVGMANTTQARAPSPDEEGYQSSAGDDWTLELADGRIRGGRVEMNQQVAETAAEEQISARIEEIRDAQDIFQASGSDQAGSAQIEETRTEQGASQSASEADVNGGDARIEEIQEVQQVLQPETVVEGSARVEEIEEAEQEQAMELSVLPQSGEQQVAVDPARDGAEPSEAVMNQLTPKSTVSQALEDEEQLVVEQRTPRLPSSELASNNEQARTPTSQTPPAPADEELPDDTEITRPMILSLSEGGQPLGEKTSDVTVDEGRAATGAVVEMDEASNSPANVQDATVMEVVTGDVMEMPIAAPSDTSGADTLEQVQVQETVIPGIQRVQETTQETVTITESENGSTVVAKELVHETVVTTSTADAEMTADEESESARADETFTTVTENEVLGLRVPQERDEDQVENVQDYSTAVVDDLDRDAEGIADTDTKQAIATDPENPRIDLQTLVPNVGDPRSAGSEQIQLNAPSFEDLHSGLATVEEQEPSPVPGLSLDQHAGSNKDELVEPEVVLSLAANGDTELTDDKLPEPASKLDTPSLHDLHSRPKEPSGPSLMDLHSRPEQDDDFEEFGEEEPEPEILEAPESQTTPSLLDLPADKAGALPSTSKEPSPQTPSLLDLHSRPNPGEEEYFDEIDPEDDMNGASVGATPEALGMEIERDLPNIPSGAASASAPENDFGGGTPEALGEVSLAPDEMYDYDKMDFGDGFGVGDSVFDVNAHSATTTGH